MVKEIIFSPFACFDFIFVFLSFVHLPARTSACNDPDANQKKNTISSFTPFSPSPLLPPALSHPSLWTPLSISLIPSHYISLSLLPAPIIPPTHSHNCSSTLKCRSQSPKPQAVDSRNMSTRGSQTFADRWPYIEYHNPRFISISYSSSDYSCAPWIPNGGKVPLIKSDGTHLHTHTHTMHRVLIEQKLAVPSIRGIIMVSICAPGRHTHTHTKEPTNSHRILSLLGGNQNKHDLNTCPSTSPTSLSPYIRFPFNKRTRAPTPRRVGEKSV